LRHEGIKIMPNEGVFCKAGGFFEKKWHSVALLYESNRKEVGRNYGVGMEEPVNYFMLII
jgi:hypothetical protein